MSGATGQAGHGWPAKSFGVAALISYGLDARPVGEIAKFVESATPLEVVLHDEQSRQGRSIVDTFVRGIEMVNFMVIVVGVAGTGEISSELFRFARVLGTRRSTLMVVEGADLPDDPGDIEVIILDKHGAWKSRLVRLFQDSGIPVDRGAAS